MEKVIKLVMKENKDIDIFIDTRHKHTILAADRNITADVIFNILDCTVGNQYKVISENPTKKDENVLVQFANLLSNIATQINPILLPDEDSFVDEPTTISQTLKTEKE